MSELILVRHGQASFGADSYDKLSPLGIRQIDILADHWQALGERFDQLYSGELVRQIETADGLRALLPASAEIQVHPGLNEYNGEPIIRMYLRDHADAEGFGKGLTLPITDRKKFQLVLEAATAHWIKGTLRATPDDVGFESWRDFQNRVHGTLDELMQRHTGGSRVLVATSGGVIALALQRALQLPDNQTIATNWMVNNSS
ncbi:MAG: histidine phosphatase family protein, partial [Pseudohongiella sp.]